MANIQSLDPTASPLDYYDWEPRRRREAHGLKQGQIVTTKKVPTRDFSERVDAALGTEAYPRGRSVYAAPHSTEQR
ncbi:hypothetical protein SMCF_7230 [Streptomyces coelicoflavus ZG0656]|nr:hypothetical protein SMCF_7230 [Streptomyces coelicoflavus ZG0656]